NLLRASVIVNGIKSSEFCLQRSTRQGDPISPLIFALVIEPLAEAIRNNQSISGYQIQGVEFKILLYADDVLLFVTNPQDAIPSVLSIIETFGYLSGYKVNMNKTIALPLGNLPRTCNIPFTWSGSGFKYLGIHISLNIRSILKQNIDIVRKSIKKDLSRWMDLPVSWMGRINLIKMNVLPRLLYPLQMLPKTRTKKTVKEIEKDLSRFIWRGKKPRLSMKTLQLPKDKGGLAFPNILLYNWSCHSRVIHEWIHTYLKDTDDPLEAWTCRPFNLLSELVSKYN
uniref:Reverse transcriptase domain-containing protein n=1 Tax=Oreochromis niloticus TaxID=8128 RepID=A0A669E7Y6_ORENI